MASSTQASKIVTSKTEARASKLKNKRAQLENLLRSRERLNYEIKQLQKSIQKDLKKTKLESSVFKKITKDGTNLEAITEAVELQEGEEPSDCAKTLNKAFQVLEEDALRILELLLAYGEHPDITS